MAERLVPNLLAGLLVGLLFEARRLGRLRRMDPEERQAEILWFVIYVCVLLIVCSAFVAMDHSGAFGGTAQANADSRLMTASLLDLPGGRSYVPGVLAGLVSYGLIAALRGLLEAQSRRVAYMAELILSRSGRLEQIVTRRETAEASERAFLHLCHELTALAWDLRGSESGTELLVRGLEVLDTSFELVRGTYPHVESEAMLESYYERTRRRILDVLPSDVAERLRRRRDEDRG